MSSVLLGLLWVEDMIRLGQFQEHGENKTERRKNTQSAVYLSYALQRNCEHPPDPLDVASARHRFVDLNIGCHTRQAVPFEDSGLEIEQTTFLTVKFIVPHKHQSRNSMRSEINLCPAFGPNRLTHLHF